MKKQLLLLSLFIPFTFNAICQSTATLWKDISLEEPATIRSKHARTLHLDFEQLKNYIDQAPWEDLSTRFNSSFEIDIPMPDGSFETFVIEKTRLMEPGLTAKYPEIRTFHGHSTKAKHRKIVIDHTFKGFHAMVRYPGDAIFIDPHHQGTTTEYICYTKSDFALSNVRNFTEFEIDGMNKEAIDLPAPLDPQMKATGNELLSYRLAMATTGEYSNYHGNTEPAVLSAVQTTVARVNEVYETDLSIRLVLIDSTVNVFYYNSGSDPFTNFSGGAMLSENQSNMNSVIGSSNYDIGHVFSTGGGGIASYRSVCGSNKAQGVTGSFAPNGDPFDIDYVAHEVGHQFGGSHTFNSVAGSCGGGNRSSATAWEPGSGSTIMAYAGLCSGDNLQNNSNDFFHTGTHTEISSFAHTGTGRSCATIVSTGNNAPTVNAGSDNFVIPMQTPFELYGAATDPQGDDLTYIWEQKDLGPAGSASSPDPNAPLFRSWQVTQDSFRIFPRLFNLINNGFAKGETLPFSTRDLTFRLTVRDNAVGGGGLDWDEIAFAVTADAGPFLVNYPDTIGDQLEGDDLNGIEWDVANTDQFPVFADLVDIFISTDGGNTFDLQLADDVPNDGFQAVMIPASLVGETQCRIKIKGVDNVFFDISNYNFTIIPFDGVINNPQPALGIEETTVDVMIFPNPVNNIVHIRSSHKIASVEVADILGKKVMDVQQNIGYVDVETLQNGVYFMKVKLKNGNIITRRIVKE